MVDKNFIKTVKNFYRDNNRPMPWRQTICPYYILLSEVMLQQTQVERVIPKFENFISYFPNVEALAKVEFKDVLAQWAGLGYNRRALWLHQAAKHIVKTYGGVIPSSIEELTKLKGVGHNTAAAICTYAFNMPVVYIETNIRAVFIHHFFPDRTDVSDKELYPLVQSHVDNNNSREWYWALMDYGVHIKKLHKNPARKSRHHVKQSKFEGSNRQLRGQILKLLLTNSNISVRSIADSLSLGIEKADGILKDMENDGLLVRDQKSSTYALI